MIAPPLARILYIEDEDAIRMVARISLETVGGFTVGLADSGPQGLEMAKSFAPDLILLDVMMPGMDGLTTFRELQSDPRTAAIPVIFLTAKVQPKEVDSYRQLGALDVIIKPFDPITLPDEIQAAWQRQYRKAS